MGMVKILNQIERQAFSDRLNQALKNSKIHKANSPSAVSREFNARYKDKSVTLHAVRKWMVGDAIPSQAKLVTLANWLGVTPDWLRFGTTSNPTALQQTVTTYDTFDQALWTDLQRLSTDQKRMVRDFIALLLRRES